MPATDQTYVRLDSPHHADWRFPPGAAEWVLTCDSSTHAELRTPDGVEQQWSDPLEALTWMADHAAKLQSPKARWVGFLSYDLGRMFESIPSIAVDDLSLPLFRFSLQYMPGEFAHDFAGDPGSGETRGGELGSTFSRDAYLEAVSRAKGYIAAGDVFQVNLSQRFTALLREPPARLYARLRRQHPAAYGACLSYADGLAILSNSPELFLRIDGASRSIVTRPIKGTRPRQPGMDEELRRSAKDQAELNMIVDLERNDLGRVCEIGSVRVTQAREIEAHPTVYHGVATIEGKLRGDVSFVDLLRATFPGGSVTGAPKIRAMQIIEELEPVRRGPYCGAIGYIAGDGSIQFNVAIRTMIIKAGNVHVPVGGGVVADSEPAAEYDETLVKAKAMFTALGLNLPHAAH